jgi:DNA-binding transcriptional MerR regulator
MEYFNSKTVSRLADVSLRQIQYWDEKGFIRPTVRQAAGRGSKRLYSFSDLVKLKIVKNLSDHGLSLRGIRLCLRHLGEDSRLKTPAAASLKYLTDGKQLFVLTDDRREILEALDWQFVFSVAIGSLVRDLSGEIRQLVVPKDSLPKLPALEPKRVVPQKRRS